MQTKYLFILIALLSLFPSHINCQIISSWKTSTKEDFISFSTANVQISEDVDGEVFLSYPFQKISYDQIFNFIPKNFVHYKNHYYSSWVENGNVYFQEYDKNFIATRYSIQVNDIDVGGLGRCSMDYLDEGYFLIAWATSGVITTSKYYQTIHAQIIKDDFIRVGNNFKVNDIPNKSLHTPIVQGNNFDHTFWIIYGEDGIYPSSKLIVHRWNILGNKVGDKFPLDPNCKTKINRIDAILKVKERGFITIWEGSDINSADGIDIYLRKYDYNGVPLDSILKVNDEDKLVLQMQASASVDSNSNVFITWADTRNTKSTFNYEFDIYGQFFDCSLNKVGKNFQINSNQFPNDIEPIVNYKDNSFVVTWKSWTNDYSVFNYFFNKWELFEVKEGILTSEILDTKNFKTKYLKISWEDSTNLSTKIKFQIRSSEQRDDLEKKKWYGPINENNFYAIKEGQQINSIHNGDRYLQYRTYFNSNKNGESPMLKSVSIDYIKDIFLDSSELFQNYPNPFNNSTVINFHLSTESYVTLTIYNTLGEIVDRMLERTFPKDNYKINWRPKSLSSGVYFYSLETYSKLGRNYKETKKMIVLK